IINTLIALLTLATVMCFLSQNKQTSRAFIESQRPQLLIYFQNNKIHYRNVSPNSFNDLTILLCLTVNDMTLNISDFFRENMVMISHDSRSKLFDTYDEVNKMINSPINKLLDLSVLNSYIEANNEGILKLKCSKDGKPDLFQSNLKIKLFLSYTYTFKGKNEKVDAQQYIWTDNSWSIN
ncbi:MAG: hypothetical protein K2P98_04540, partial [Neisseriaceae bacterium]|nr:hypothetical protein [Neisseriaceae bacterium]